MTYQGAISQLDLNLSRLIQRIQASGAAFPRLVRLETPLPPLDQLVWLMLQEDAVKVFWSARDHPYAIAAIGSADDRTLADSAAFDSQLKHIQELLVGAQEGPSVRYFGGLSFSDSASSHWPEFPYYGRFVLPLIEIVRSHDEHYTLACNLLMTTATQGSRACAELRQRLKDLRFGTANPWPRWRSRVVHRQDSLAPIQWRHLVQQVLDLERANQLKKLVLSREVTLEIDTAVSPWQLLNNWRRYDNHCFSFALQFDGTHSFVGCSPERLFQMQGLMLNSEAVAGTVCRGADRNEDAGNEDLLRNDPKIARENTLVREYIRHHLHPLCRHVYLDESPSVLKLERVQHLRHRLYGELRQGIGIVDILRALHPTPAVGGVPKGLAIDLIQELEPHNRGWYSGTVGYIGSHTADFAVAIRCARLQEDRVRLYSGAGIVAGSQPQAEWQELESKIGTILSLFH